MSKLQEKTEEFKKACENIGFQTGINYADYVMESFREICKKIDVIEGKVNHHEEVIAEMHIQNVVDAINATNDAPDVYMRKSTKEACVTRID